MNMGPVGPGTRLRVAGRLFPAARKGVPARPARLTVHGQPEGLSPQATRSASAAPLTVRPAVQSHRADRPRHRRTDEVPGRAAMSGSGTGQTTF